MTTCLGMKYSKVFSLKNGNQFFDMRNILFVIPHPDDEVVGSCLIIKEFFKKKKISILFLTNGVISPSKNWFWEKKKFKKKISIRYQEMLKTLEYLEITNFFLQDLPTRSLKTNIVKTYNLIKKIVLDNEIDTLFCPAYEGGHQDHDVTNYIASKFNKICKVYEFAEYNFYKNIINSNTFIELNGTEHTINLNEQQRKFKKMCLDTYRSETNNVSYIKLFQESFRPIKNYDYSAPPHKGILFYRRFSFFSWHPKVEETKPRDLCETFKKLKIKNEV